MFPILLKFLLCHVYYLPFMHYWKHKSYLIDPQGKLPCIISAYCSLFIMLINANSKPCYSMKKNPKQTKPKVIPKARRQCSVFLKQEDNASIKA